MAENTWREQSLRQFVLREVAPHSKLKRLPSVSHPVPRTFCQQTHVFRQHLLWRCCEEIIHQDVAVWVRFAAFAFHRHHQRTKQTDSLQKCCAGCHRRNVLNLNRTCTSTFLHKHCASQFWPLRLSLVAVDPPETFGSCCRMPHTRVLHSKLPSFVAKSNSSCCVPFETRVLVVELPIRFPDLFDVDFTRVVAHLRNDSNFNCVDGNTLRALQDGAQIRQIPLRGVVMVLCGADTQTGTVFGLSPPARGPRHSWTSFSRYTVYVLISIARFVLIHVARFRGDIAVAPKRMQTDTRGESELLFTSAIDTRGYKIPSV